MGQTLCNVNRSLGDGVRVSLSNLFNVDTTLRGSNQHRTLNVKIFGDKYIQISSLYFYNRDVDPYSFGSVDPDLYSECGSRGIK